MIFKDTIYTVFYDDNSSFSDYSENMADYSRDTATMELNKDDDYLYIGYYKPFGYTYAELSTVNENANTFSAEYYNGSWTSLTIYDESKGFTRSGFLQWTKPTDWTSVEINSTTKYYIRLRPSATHSSTVLKGLNIVFSDDIDLAKEVHNIGGTFFKGSRDSYINDHVTARDRIIQEFRNKGVIKNDYEYISMLQQISTQFNAKKILTPIDLHDIEEIRLASTYLALSNIYYVASDDPEGNLKTKAGEYERKGMALVRNAIISFDTDDDGHIDELEKAQSLKVVRLIR